MQGGARRRAGYRAMAMTTLKMNAATNMAMMSGTFQASSLVFRAPQCMQLASALGVIF